ncbi:minor tail protein [Mycobacterium phage Oaker]|uniref:minor tail protein n=2 Tax=unclassified Konstantinevirus TaxID=2852502 RepID=UPI0003E3A666|nr:minor tail protein [Mycobacterium phage Oaker]AHG24419.1 minor tail protein [Mycobacterium phage Oaker]
MARCVEHDPMITDKLRFTILEANTNEILSRDLVVKEPQVTAQLSAPSMISFRVPKGEQATSSAGIEWKSWGQWVVAEMEIDYEREIVACCITRDCKIDPGTGDMVVEAVGFSDYPRGIPWLENWNDIAVDPFEIVQRIWNHLQSYSNANLGVEVYPASSGTQMLPGYGYDGSILIFDFFALFVRAIDFPDAGDYITGLSRDIPFDYFEEATWNEDRTEVIKKIRLAYPSGGVRQEHLAFKLGDNVIEAELAEEKDIEWTSDVLIRGWFPGKVYSSRLSNAEPDRLRRTVIEEDAKIDSTERAAAWAKRKLTRRQVPKYWQTVIVDPNHPHAPFGSHQLGDSLWITGDYPWIGEVAYWHRFLGWSYDEAKGIMQYKTKAEGAFDYDPIEYNPNPGEIEDHNLLSNGYFDRNLAGWIARRGTWIRVASMGYDTDGCVRVQHNDSGESFESHKISCQAGETFNFRGAVRYENVTTSEDGIGFSLKINHYQDGGLVSSHIAAAVSNPSGDRTWVPLSQNGWVVPEGVNDISVVLTVDARVTGGYSMWDDIKVLRV